MSHIIELTEKERAFLETTFLGVKYISSFDTSKKGHFTEDELDIFLFKLKKPINSN